jgi:homoserine kinase
MERPGVEIAEISGIETDLPADPEKNVAGKVLLKFMEDHPLSFGLRVRIHKGIPLSSGMGGSAASASAALTAAALFVNPVPGPRELLCYALEGELCASGSPHGDNVTPCLYGGLTLLRSLSEAEIIRIPFPQDVRVVLVHPDLRLDTREGRKALGTDAPIKTYVAQSANLAGFIAGCFLGDMDLVARSLKDELVEARRAPLVKGFAEVKTAALEAGAMGMSLSGSGPSVFAWCRSDADAERVRGVIEQTWNGLGVKTEGWISEISGEGARVVEAY